MQGLLCGAIAGGHIFSLSLIVHWNLFSTSAAYERYFRCVCVLFASSVGMTLDMMLVLYGRDAEWAVLCERDLPQC